MQQHGGDARVLAGGQSLIPAMRFRLARPAVLVDINEISELNYVRMSDGVLAVGAIAQTPTSSARHGSAIVDGASCTMYRVWSPIRSCGRWARWLAACATTI